MINPLAYWRRRALEAEKRLEVVEEELSRLRPIDGEIERLKALIDRDRTGLAAGLDRVRRIAKGFDWICESRGPYEWDDDRYRLEVGSLIVQVCEAATAALVASGALADEAFNPPRAVACATELERLCQIEEGA